MLKMQRGQGSRHFHISKANSVDMKAESTVGHRKRLVGVLSRAQMRGLPGLREILMRVRATSLNYRDLMVLKGGGRGPMKLGVVPLSDGAGEVAAMDLPPAGPPVAVLPQDAAAARRSSLPGRTQP
jgi:NADPH:quinone reductase-like Zn-dependent oxidoreductase